MSLVGKSGGKPNYGCPFCSARNPYKENGNLYTLGDLIELHQVRLYLDFLVDWIWFIFLVAWYYEIKYYIIKFVKKNK